MSKPTIGLIGLAGSGKDTAAEALGQFGYWKSAFASALKDLAYEFGWDGKKDERGRALLQDLGMAARRYNPNFWIEQLTWPTKGRAFGIPQVFTDVRFQNEADYIRERHGIIIRIVRPGLIPDSHESELNQSQIAADYEIVNDGSIEDLHNKIIAIISK
jgi:hypothetical protein